MMRTHGRRRALLGTLILFAFGCGSESATTAPVDNYLPVISNFWRDTKVSAHTLTLLSTDDLKPTGSFTGSEKRPNTPTDGTVSGSWTNSTFTMSISRSGVPETYSGKFISRDTLRLIRSADTPFFWHT